ncbi:hypothetical protein AB0L05_36775 [Nonomuraea pusilla]|uniref:hypothetical protein n=1 Tax=Nonomuraea pusilla TaxID=46177 RepID=UPI003316CD44
MRHSSIAAAVAAALAVTALVPGAATAQAAGTTTCPGLLRTPQTEFKPVVAQLSYQAPNKRDGEDIITAAYTKIPQADEVQFVLHSAPQVTWWKEISVTDQKGHVLRDQRDFTQDAKHDTRVLTLTRAEASACAYVWFSKAKTFGKHTPMYPVFVQASDLGNRIDLTWVKD